PSFTVLWGITAVVVAVTVIRRWKQLTWAAMLPIAWFAVNGLLITRVAPLFGLVAMMMLAPGWAATEPAPPAAPRVAGLWVVDASAVAVVVLLNLVPESRCLTME